MTVERNDVSAIGSYDSLKTVDGLPSSRLQVSFNIMVYGYIWWGVAT